MPGTVVDIYLIHTPISPSGRQGKVEHLLSGSLLALRRMPDP